MKTCERFISLADVMDPCGRKATHYVPNYFHRNVAGKKGDRSYYLCRGHASEWNHRVLIERRALVLR